MKTTTRKAGWVNPSAPKRTHGRHCGCIGCARRRRKASA